MNDDLSGKINAMKQKLFQLQQYQASYFGDIQRLLAEIEALEKQIAAQKNPPYTPPVNPYQQPDPQQPLSAKKQTPQLQVPPVVPPQQQQNPQQQNPQQNQQVPPVVPPQQQQNPQVPPVVPPQQQQHPQVPPQQQQQVPPVVPPQQQQNPQYQQKPQQQMPPQYQQPNPQQQWQQQQQQKQMWQQQYNPPPPQPPKFAPQPPKPNAPKGDNSWEKFVGGKLLTFIGIGILLIGVFIGVKYSIEHNLINELTRIVLSYTVGIGLLGFAIYLKKNYKTFSAILLSGAMAIFYFVTYVAWSFYDLIPQGAAFGMMVVFTIFTVFSAIRYNIQAIAHIGMVGAYGVPFLLSNDSGRIALFFSYISLINIGILVISFRKNWRVLYYVTYSLTWIIFATWFWRRYEPAEHLGIAIGFSSIFFAIFYAVSLSYKLVRKEKFDAGDVTLILINSAFYYGMGYYALHIHPDGDQYTGLFTVLNAALHSIAAFAIWRTKTGDKQLFWFTAGLVLLFLTIAFPVQMDGNWVTMAWAVEAAILFTIGRTRRIIMYEIFAYPMIAVAFFSMMHDWAMRHYHMNTLNEAEVTTIFMNKWFLTSFVVIASYAVIALVNRSKRFPLPEGITPNNQSTIHVISWLLFFVLSYFTFGFEINLYWNHLYEASAMQVTDNTYGVAYEYMQHDEDLRLFKRVWLINFSLLYFTAISLLNWKVLKDAIIGNLSFILNVLTIFIFIFFGLYEISELRESYLVPSSDNPYPHDSGHLMIRYWSIPIVLFAIIVEFLQANSTYMAKWLRVGFDFVLHYCVIHILSSELLHWMDVTGNDNKSYKLGLSLLWGTYALYMVVMGIWRRKAYLRISAFILLGIIVGKLFFYDLVHLPTLSKTVVFVVIGIVILIISFLYNKYKSSMFPDDEPEKKD